MSRPLDVFLFLARLDVLDGLGLVRVERFEVEKFFWEVRHAVQCDQVGHTLLALASEARLAGSEAAVALSTRLHLSNAEGEQAFSRLDRQWI